MGTNIKQVIINDCPSKLKPGIITLTFVLCDAPRKRFININAMNLLGSPCIESFITKYDNALCNHLLLDLAGERVHLL